MKYQFNEIQKSFPNNSNKANLLSYCYYSMVLESDWGEALKPIITPNDSDFVKNFGEVTDTNYKEYYQAKNFLKYSTNFKPIRVVNQLSCNKQNNYSDNTTPSKSEIADFYNSDVAVVNTITTDRIGIVEKYINPNEDISISICSTLTAWDKEISYEKLNLVISKTTTEPPESPMNNDMYLLPTSSTGDWLGHDGEYAIWLHDNESWNFVSVLANDTIYVRDENKEYNRISGVWVEQDSYYNQFEHIKYKNESAYRIVYEEPYQNSFGKVIKFNQISIQRPDFDNGDFLILIFKKINNRFRLVERFLTNYGTAESDINFISKYVYIKIEEGTEAVPNTNPIDTYNYSIVESRFRHHTNTNLSITQTDYEMCIEMCIEDTQIQIVSDREYSGDMNLFSNKFDELNSKKILVSGCYDNTRYNNFNAIIDDFSLFRTDPYYNTIKYSNAFVISSQVLENNNRKYIPLYGDVVGLILSNLEKDVLINAGQRNGRLLLDKSRILLKATSINDTELIQNNINNVSWDNELKYHYLTNDSMLNTTSISVGYTLLFNIVEDYINDYFIEYGLSCPRLKELEKLKNILEHKIKEFGLNSNVTYSSTTFEGVKTIYYSVILEYKTVIKEIIVNFTLS